MATQLDLFAPPPPAPHIYVPRQSAKVQTRAGEIAVYDDDYPPFELTVRGIDCVVSWSGGFCTHAVEPAGSLFWSETGFRSFGFTTIDQDEIAERICAYVDTPANNYGMGGKMVRWWPSYVLQWRQSLAFEIEMTTREGRAGVWGQWGPEAWEDHWHRHDMRLQDAIEQMRADGIDPNDVGKPAHFVGKWPTFSAEG
jgi:hypothetical protein